MARQKSPLIHQVLFTSDADDGCGPMAVAVFNNIADSARAVASSAGFRAAGTIAPGAMEAVADISDLSSMRPEVVTPRRIRDATLMVHLGTGFENDSDGVLVLAWDLPTLDQGSPDFRVIRCELERRIQELVATRRWATPRALCPICLDAIDVPRDITSRQLNSCPGCGGHVLWIPGHFKRCAPIVRVVAHRPGGRGTRHGLA